VTPYCHDNTVPTHKHLLQATNHTREPNRAAQELKQDKQNKSEKCCHELTPQQPRPPPSFARQLVNMSATCCHQPNTPQTRFPVVTLQQQQQQQAVARCSQGWPSKDIQVLRLTQCLMCMHVCRHGPRVPPCRSLVAHRATHSSTHAASTACNPRGREGLHMYATAGLRLQVCTLEVSVCAPGVCLEATIRELCRKDNSSSVRPSTGAPTRTAQQNPAHNGAHTHHHSP
jgi:hypothetical protein